MRFARPKRICFVLLCAASGLFFSAALSAHPLHISLCEADYRAETGKLEIALRLFTDDAEAALSRRAEKKIVVEKIPAADLDRLLFAYAQTAFLVKKRDGMTAPCSWIGHELKDTNQHLWLYFEYLLPEGVEGLCIDDRVMRETFPDQLNSVLIREHPVAGSSQSDLRQTTLLFPDAAEHTVVFVRGR